MASLVSEEVRIISNKLRAFGIEPSKTKGNCARSAIYNGHIKLEEDSDLDKIVYSGKLRECGHNCSATLRDLLEQPDYAGFETNLADAVIFCDRVKSLNQLRESKKDDEYYDPDDSYEDYEEGYCNSEGNEGRAFVTEFCFGNPWFDQSGHAHNHCSTCSNFGECLGDYREGHCEKCGGHYIVGPARYRELYKCDCEKLEPRFNSVFTCPK